MTFDIKYIPFSRYGSYFSFSYISKEVWGRDFKVDKEGLYLRTLHGNAKLKEIFLLELIDEYGNLIKPEIIPAPEVMKLKTSKGEVDICFPLPEIVRIKGKKEIGLRLSLGNPYSFLISMKENEWLLNYYASAIQISLLIKSGRLKIDAPWTGTRCTHVKLDILPADDEFELIIKEVNSDTENDEKIEEFIKKDFYECVLYVKREFEKFLKDSILETPDELSTLRQTAGYLLWSSVVKPNGILKRPAIVMSKNWMTDIWSWDHCFNAIALSYKNPELAWDQFMVMFDFQNDSGALPDYVNDHEQYWNFSKPPIHGWTLRKLIENSAIDVKKLKEAYVCLSNWTNWWLEYRDYDSDGIPQYNHGNDSGWDNSTVFIERPPIESPDLSAFLVIQMETLSNIAEKIGKKEEAVKWRERSFELLDRMLKHFLTEDELIPRVSGNHKQIKSMSLLPLMSMIIGEKLPKKVLEKMIKRLKDEFLTPYGLATENPNSKFYESDGYWRGPIWAPTTMLIVDSLKKVNENELALEISKRFMKLIEKGGFAENFDAITGEGLRDRAYTWTASVFLILARKLFQSQI